MAKGVSIKFRSYSETIPKFLSLIKLDNELKKHNKIVLKPSLKNSSSKNTDARFVEQILQFCLLNKDPESKVFIAEGSDGEDTEDLFDKLGYRTLSEKYAVGLIDLNSTDVESIEKPQDFIKFDKIMYPKILLESFVISLPALSEDSETEMAGSLSNMLGAFSSSYYKGIFSKMKNKIRKWPIKYSIHDVLKCKVPEFTIVDASERGLILAGNPIDVDEQCAKLLGKNWREIQHLRLIKEGFSADEPDKHAESVEKVISTEAQ